MTVRAGETIPAIMVAGFVCHNENLSQIAPKVANLTYSMHLLTQNGARRNGGTMPKPTNKNTPVKAYHLCQEAAYYIMQEKQRREDLGRPHTSIPDILNDWILDYAQMKGFLPPPSKQQDYWILPKPACDRREEVDPLRVLAEMARGAGNEPYNGD